MTLLLVRHAEAESRSGWSAPDVLRPLSNRGRRQAAGLVHLLGDQVAIARLVSSPSLRCIETLAPLAAVLGLSLEIADALAEGAEPKDAVELGRTAAHAGPALVLCSHGDLIPKVLELLHTSDGIDLGRSPRCQKGSTWRLEGDPGRLRTATYLPPS